MLGASLALAGQRNQLFRSLTLEFSIFGKLQLL